MHYNRRDANYLTVVVLAAILMIRKKQLNKNFITIARPFEENTNVE
jgi:hypothetical protein